MVDCKQQGKLPGGSGVKGAEDFFGQKRGIRKRIAGTKTLVRNKRRERAGRGKERIPFDYGVQAAGNIVHQILIIHKNLREKQIL